MLLRCSTEPSCLVLLVLCIRHLNPRALQVSLAGVPCEKGDSAVISAKQGYYIRNAHAALRPVTGMPRDFG